MADFDPFSVMRTLLPDFENRLDRQMTRRTRYDTLARRNAEINREQDPESQGSVAAAQVSRAGGWPHQGMFNGGLNTEYWKNNRELARLQDLMRGGVGGSWRVNAGSASPVGKIWGGGETDRALAALRQATGYGG